MNFSFYIARRYLFSKKSHNAINIISLIAACAIAVATMAAVCVLSVFNGFSSFAFNSFNSFDPDIKITPVKGKVFDPTGSEFQSLHNIVGIDIISGTLEESVMVENDHRQVPATLKGVSDNFVEISHIDDILLEGEFILKDEITNYVTVGIGLARSLGIYSNQRYPITIYAPKRNVAVNMANPTSSFTPEHIYVSNLFMVGQEVYDENYLLAPIDILRSLFEYPKEVSALEIKLKENSNSNTVKKEIIKLIGKDYFVKDRYEQQEVAFRMINIEKWVTFLMICFIILIAVFNVIGSLSILIVDKQKDINTLRSLGANNKLISRIFLFEGWMISALGCFIGIILGVVLCLGQQHFGWIRMGTPGTFAVTAYPVAIEIADLVIILVSGLSIGFVAVLYPVRYLSKKWLNS